MKPSKYKPLPEFEPIKFSDILPMSIILEVGANKLTQISEHLMGWKYDKCYTHALNYIDDGNMMSMGATASIITKDKLSKSHIYTVISYIDLTDKQIADGIAWCYKYVKDNPFKPYDVMGYFGLITRIIPAMRKIQWLHGSEGKMFCSDLVVHVYQQLKYALYDGINSEMIAPTDLFDMNSVWDKAYFRTLVL